MPGREAMPVDALPEGSKTYTFEVDRQPWISEVGTGSQIQPATYLMAAKNKYGLVNRELSWLSFNARVLQEAHDRRVPLYERLKFLSIYSSNLDEFFRVRVASLRSLLRLKKKTVHKLGIDPKELLRQIHDTVTAQQEEFGATFRGEILPELADRGIHLIDESHVGDEQGAYLKEFFRKRVRSRLEPVVLGSTDTPFLENQQIYLAVELWPSVPGIDVAAEEPCIGLVEVPSPPVDRFVSIPSDDEHRFVMFLDDVVRYNLPDLFPEFAVGSAYAIKLSRDAELYLDDEYAGSFVEQIKKSLEKRERGLPCRFLYDLHASFHVISFLEQTFDLSDEDLVLGGRYHNLNDLADFPRFGLSGLTYERLEPLDHPELEFEDSILEAVARKDRLIHFPYQKFDYVVRFLQEAVEDDDVESIWITLYRTAADSSVVKALLDAARAGKKVTAFVEVKARFDEASNLDWAEQMEAAGVRTLYSFRELKVHTKLALVGRREGDDIRWYAYLGTGNFNELTARVYADDGLFTADPRLADEVRLLFGFLDGSEEDPSFDHLLVAPFHLRKAFVSLIENEMTAASDGEPSGLIAKMNSLEDEKLIHKLYEASSAGVDIDMIVRGICCLIPGVPGQSERIRIRSIVDRFLEHARVYIFQNRGDELYYLASADWMKRNMSSRVEVAFPLYDVDVRREVRQLIDLQRQDNVKARVIDAEQKNAYVAGDGTPVRAQSDTYDLLKRRWETAPIEMRQEAPAPENR